MGKAKFGRWSRPSAGTVLGLVACVLALTGSAYADPIRAEVSALITGKKIKNNSITSTDIRNKSLLAKDFKAGQLATAVKGDPGLQGPAGPQGPKGDPGAPGAPGVAGSARAFAVVRAVGGALKVDASMSKSVQSASYGNGNPDRPCVQLAPEIDAATAVVVAMPVGTNAAISMAFRQGGAGSQACPPNSIALVSSATHHSFAVAVM